MRARPRTIQIYLPSGDARGIRVSELTTSIVRVVEVPRALLNDFFAMPEATQVGLYLLVGDSDELDQPWVYIGQSGNLSFRLAEHQRTKDFWTRVLVVVSLTNNLTQTHTLYLEWLAIREARLANRYQVENGNAGSRPHTPAPLEADCHDLFEITRTLVATMGQPVFEALTCTRGPKDRSNVFYCRAANYDATAHYTEEGMVVLKGSKARKDVVPSMIQPRSGSRRDKLIADGTLILDGNYFVFQRDVLFKSPSGASDTVIGSNTNGWTSWKTSDGLTLDELKRAPKANAVFEES